jgi:predicted aspartyl protease
MVELKCGFNNGPAGLGCDLLVNLGPTLLVNIGFDPNHNPATIVPPVPGITDVHALVDTGATECCIDALLAVQLKLSLVNRRQISGVSGVHLANVYLAQVHVPMLGVTMNGAFSGVNLRVGGQMNSALIGRTFLRHFKMLYEGNTGTVTLTSV